jgi:hypothetical protein
MRTILTTVLVAAALAVPAVASADTLTFVAVDSTLLGTLEGHDVLTVTGRFDGDGTTRTVHLRDSDSRDGRTDRCNRQAILAMSKPGRWRLTVIGDLVWPGSGWYDLRRCGLTRID